METSIQINHHNTPAIKFRALGTHYPTGKYMQSYSDARKVWVGWFELIVDNVEITWYEDWTSSNPSEEE